MLRAFIKLVCTSIMTGLLTGIVFSQPAKQDVQKAAEGFVEAYNGKRYAEIEQQFNAQMKAAISGDKLKEFLDGAHQQFGKIVSIGEPRSVAPAAAIFPANFERGKLDLQVALDGEGKVAALRLSPPSPEKPKTASRNKTKLMLPFRDDWFIFWGGDTVEKNYHQNAPTQRFAFDIVKIDSGGQTHKGDGTKNEDYYAFGQELLAPAAGVVTYVVDDVHDNKPGEMNRMYVPGNLVIIKHAENEYSLLAHFKQNSIRVKVGDQVKQSQVIGLCGNSGNSSEPHLHVQVQSTPFFQDEASMKVFFESVVVKRSGKSEVFDGYSPEKGDIVSNNLKK